MKGASAVAGLASSQCNAPPAGCPSPSPGVVYWMTRVKGDEGEGGSSIESAAPMGESCFSIENESEFGEDGVVTEEMVMPQVSRVRWVACGSRMRMV